VKLAPKAFLVAVALGAIPALISACGSEGVQVNDRGAHLFAERCAGCHTLSAAGTHGSVGERISGPNLDFRKETKTTALYAIRNGGFSGAIMPQNVVVGKDADDVAAFVAKYAGTKAKSPPAPKPNTDVAPSNAGVTGQSGATGGGGAGKAGSKKKRGGKR
jgi:mono/diheme cytochrome c family protein